eukprot:1158605-Pelagomonas_calceolata.AAC.2
MQTTNISTVKRMNKAFGKLPRQLMQRANLLPVASLPQSPSAYRDLDEAAQQAAEELEKSEEASHVGGVLLGGEWVVSEGASYVRGVLLNGEQGTIICGWCVLARSLFVQPTPPWCEHSQAASGLVPKIASMLDGVPLYLLASSLI